MAGCGEAHAANDKGLFCATPMTILFLINFVLIETRFHAMVSRERRKRNKMTEIK